MTREHGAAWDDARSLREQDGWAEHAAFMDALADETFVVLGGPVGDGAKTLLLVDAESEDAVRARLAADPWTPMGLLRIASIERWEILLASNRFR